MFFADRTLAGDRPPRYGEKNVPITVGRGPVPRHAAIERETAWVCVWFSRIERSRGTGPRATVDEAFSLLPVRDQALPNYSLFSAPNLANS